MRIRSSAYPGPESGGPKATERCTRAAAQAALRQSRVRATLSQPKCPLRRDDLAAAKNAISEGSMRIHGLNYHAKISSRGSCVRSIFRLNGVSQPALLS